VKQYLDTVREVLEKGTRKVNRTGIDTLSTFNINYEIDMAEGFPLLTTKEISWKNIVVENLWFLSGDTHIGILKKHGCKFWDPWADDDGKVPSAYGNFWRHFPVHIDGRPEFLDQVVQLDDSGEPMLCLHLTQRSADVALGVPYNIAGYAFLLHMLSHFSGIKPGIFAHTLVDAHVYTSKPDGTQSEYDHVPGLQDQLTRTPRKLPQLSIDPSIKSLDDIQALLKLSGYEPYSFIPFKVAV